MKNRTPKEDCRGARAAGGGIEPPACLQTYVAGFTQNGSQSASVKRLFHDAQDFRIVPAFHPDDTAEIETVLNKPRCIAIRAVYGP